jgi:hypothetical protein
MTPYNPSYCPIIAGENHMRSKINCNRADKEPESYSISNVKLGTNLDEKTKSIESNNMKYTAMGNKHATIGISKNSTCLGIRNFIFQREIVGYGVRKTYILHSIILNRNFL